MVILLLAGCAKFPGTADTVGTRVVLSMKVDGRIRFGTESGQSGSPYIYIFALNPSEQDNPTNQGPIPVIAPPWGNGFVAGSCTHFVLWDPASSSPFTLYKFTNADLTQWSAVGVPINATLTQVGDAELRLEIALSQLAPSLADSQKFRSLQVNFLTMDRVPQTGTTKFWDALGDSTSVSTVNSWVTIPLRSSATFDNNRSGQIEPRGDQVDPDLDLIDWSVEVRL